MNIKMNVPTPKAAPTPPEKQLPPAVTPDGANPATSGVDAADLKVVEVVKPVIEPKKDKDGKIIYAMPSRGCRFRFARGEYVLGELDSLKNVQDWVVKNEVDPTKIEVLDADGVWLNFDTVAK